MRATTELSVPPRPASAAANQSATAVPLKSYDPNLIARYAERRPGRVLGRLLRTIWPFLLFFLQLQWDRASGAGARNQIKRAVRLREILTDLGPTYIKIGQALSTRPDLVPPAYLDELTLLQDRLPPVPNSEAFALIRAGLGRDPAEIYAEFDPEPIAAASLGQVYRARLKTGERVAVKVQRPNLIPTVMLDLYLQRRLLGWIERNVRQVKSDLQAILDEFGRKLFEEMDYVQEGKNAERFASFFVTSMPEIYVPRIYWDYTCRQVLTMEWIDGLKLTRLEEIERAGLNARAVIEAGVQCSLRQLLEHGFFHADPHPGNLLVMADGRLAYLDFGMMSEVEPAQRYGLIQAIVHMVNRDFEGLARDYVQLGFLKSDQDLTPIVPVLEAVFGQALGSSIGSLNIKSITDNMSAMMYDLPFRVPAFFALIIRSLVTLEGIAISVDPEFKVLEVAYPYVARRLLSDNAPQLRASLSELLFKDGAFRWNRLENLVRNARSAREYNINRALDQAAEFLLSERGAAIREKLIDELTATKTVNPNVPGGSASGLQNLERLWSLLREDPKLDVRHLFAVLSKLVLKPEGRDLSRRVAGRLLERELARLLRRALLPGIPSAAL
ncbi:ABC1 kinase family protein [Gloeobacter kilaueensis]|uniref:Ubiquinone biosynthesis protein UbiB n=1 Tax=Gloeobacter kilaueensis (strain ATCC BAA-2537 / CCAP 1431/1 / ULC 316 / JS1) TaxID=1183438 RepID=U5QIF2_GLOK1|nr:AarF/ABC1/UbiB kinase family protein [Gloeobacter kilaueensis]AGY58767.1 ubiquinone biosynthesis protein UbiB [Gloeobacter kilaueensis JS1]